MSTFVLRETVFAPGINIYTGNVQGGHAYSTIKDSDWNNVVELTCVVDQEWLDALALCNPEDVPTYRLGESTVRLLNMDVGRALAVEWMKANHPDDMLVTATGGITLFPETT